MVCRPGSVNLTTDLPPTGAEDPYLAQCGYCITCFKTEEAYFEFESTSVARINASYVALLCEVASNLVSFSINWSISEEEGGETMMLEDGSFVDGNLVSVKVEQLSATTSILTAPNVVLERDVQCTAESTVLSQSSEKGAFEYGNRLTSHPPLNNQIIVI